MMMMMNIVVTKKLFCVLLFYANKIHFYAREELLSHTEYSNTGLYNINVFLPHALKKKDSRKKEKFCCRIFYVPKVTTVTDTWCSSSLICHQRQLFHPTSKKLVVETSGGEKGAIIQQTIFEFFSKHTLRSNFYCY